MYVRLRHRLVPGGWRRVRIYIGPDADHTAYRGDLSVVDNDRIDEWTPIRQALFSGAGIEVEEVEEVNG